MRDWLIGWTNSGLWKEKMDNVSLWTHLWFISFKKLQNCWLWVANFQELFNAKNVFFKASQFLSVHEFSQKKCTAQSFGKDSHFGNIFCSLRVIHTTGSTSKRDLFYWILNFSFYSFRAATRSCARICFGFFSSPSFNLLRLAQSVLLEGRKGLVVR